MPKSEKKSKSTKRTSSSGAATASNNKKKKLSAVVRDVPKPDPADFTSIKPSASLPTRRSNDDLIFDDHPDFNPNLTPKEVLQAGSFGGTYFRDIYSSVLGKECKDAWKEIPQDWIKGLDIRTQVASQDYRIELNKYKVKCGGDLNMWEQSGWIKKQDPYGWFQWYCRFYQGRRTVDDARQISRWAKCAGVRGRWKSNLITKVVKANSRYDDSSISPVVRQVLLHWGYRLTEQHFKIGELIVRKRLKL